MNERDEGPATRSRTIRSDMVADPPFHYSPAVRRGPFIFASGQTATDWRVGVAPKARLGHQGNSARAEIGHIYDNLLELIRTAGGQPTDVLRLDSFYAAPRIQAGHFAARDDHWGDDAMTKFASVGIQVQRFLPTGTRMMMDLIAALPEGHVQREPIWVEEVGGSPIGIPMGTRYGDLIFLSGRMAYDAKNRTWPFERRGLQLWEDYPPQVAGETRYLLDVIAQILEGSESSLEDVVKAQVYLTSLEDITFVDEVWREYFPVDPPARNFVHAQRLAVSGGRLEIGVVALRRGGATHKRVIAPAELPPPLFHQSHAVQAGSLCFLSGVLAVDGDGLMPGVRASPDFPFNVSQGRVEMEAILNTVEAICTAAGGSIDDVVRVQSFFTDLSDFDGAHSVWSSRFRHVPPAWTICQVGGLPASGASLGCDVIAYIDPDVKRDAS
jgi:enamine deaminase RidA (YjgF/YER057c/UK114 family)